MCDGVFAVAPSIIPFSFQGDHLFEGVLARVSCVVYQGDLPIGITWLKDGRPLNEHNDGVSVRQIDDFSSSLTVEHVRHEHRGDYTCVAANAAATTNYTASLVVNVPPKWTFAPKNVSVFAGKEAFFDCQASGFPQPDIKWFRAEGPTKSQQEPVHTNHEYQVFHNGSLHIAATRMHHRGFYFCEATNGVGVGLSKLVHLTVHVPPVVEFKQRNQTGKLGAALTLRCSVVGERPLKFSWKMNEQVLDLNKTRYKVHQFELQNKVVSEVTILKLLPEDSTVYTCLCQNEFGHDESQFFLTVQEPPHPPLDVKVSDVGNRTVQVSWKEPFNGNNPITNYLIQYRETAGKNKDVLYNETVHGKQTWSHLHGLRPSFKHEVHVLAENQLGWSKASEPTYVTTGEEAPTAPPQMVRVDPADEKTLKVSWKPPKAEFWNGNIRGYFVGYKVSGSSDAITFRLLEVPEDYKESLSYLLTDLKKYTQYSVVVQALNSGGKGPLSDEVFAMTSEGVPAKPPLDVRCSVLTSQSVHVTWQPPPAQSLNGILRGYKVLYRSAEEWYDSSQIQSKTATVSKLTLHDLAKFTNYSIQVLSFTKKGDGVSSDPVFCQTLEDVPGPPGEIKALAGSGDSVLVSWQPPPQPNGIVVKYYVYVQLVATAQDEQPDKAKYSSLGNTTVHEVIGLKRNNRYQFWVTALTSVGEGTKSKVVAQSPKDTSVGARVASFGNVITTTTKHDIKFQCRAAGIPPPDRKWNIRGEPLKQSDRLRVLSDGALLLRDVRKTDAGNYTCRVDNGYGDDSVTHTLLIIAAPSRPQVEVLLATATTIDVHWKGVRDGGSQILRYLLYYRQESGHWDKFEVDPKEDSFQLRNLRCGTEYQMYVVAENLIGQSEPSETITTHTKGSVPDVPLKEKLLEESAASATVRLDAWQSVVCPIQYFAVAYHLHSRQSWITVSDNIRPEQRTMVIRDLHPGTRYRIKVTAHNAAGSTKAEYDFATLTLTGATVSPLPPPIMKKPGLLSFMDKRVLIPASISLALFLLLLLLICCCFRCFRSNSKKKLGKSPKGSGRHRSSGHQALRAESGDYNDSFAYLRGTAHQGNAFSNGTLGSQDDPAPYATVHLSDFQPSQHHSLASRHSAHSSLQKGAPAFDQALRIASGSVGGSSDLQSFRHQLPTAPPMSEGYGGGSCGYQGLEGSKPLLPKRNPPSDHRNTPSHHLSGHEASREETTFVFPNSDQGTQQGTPCSDGSQGRRGHSRQKSRFFQW